jgi:hypothetical protein
MEMRRDRPVCQPPAGPVSFIDSGVIGLQRVNRPMSRAIGTDIVGALERFEASLAGFASGLSEIEASPSYLMLMDATGTGETARKYAAAARDAKDLWTLIDAAGSQLTAARAHMNNKGAVGQNGVELRRLLEEPWFAITMSGGQPRNYSVSQTMAEIRRRYEAIRAGVSEIDQLWVTVLPRVEAARTTLERLEGEAQDLGVLEPLIGRAKALAEDLAERLVSDPASVSTQDGANLDIQVANAAKQMSALRTGHDRLDADFSSTEELLASLRVLLARAEAARVESLAKVADPTGLVRVPSASVLDGPDGLAKRLDDLFENTSARAWTQKRSLLDSWLTSARKLEAQLMRAADANRVPLDEREELRGRLRAYTAKIAAMGRAEDLMLADLVDKARLQLYTAPTDIPAAEAAIADLAARLRA